MSAQQSPSPLHVGPEQPFRLSGSAWALLALVAALSLLAFTWPLFLAPSSMLAQNTLAPMILALIVPFVLMVVVAQVSGTDASAKSLAMLGVMTAVVAAVRPLGAGMAGIETVFFPILLAGRVFGPGFGFVLGCTGLFTSALITGGVGTWLPYQMLSSGLMGLFAGLLPRVRGRLEIAMLAGFGALWAFIFGWLMDFASWPFALGLDTGLSYRPDASIGTNLWHFVLFNVATSMGWNLGRALTTAILVLAVGAPLLGVLRRSARMANFVDSRNESSRSAVDPKYTS